MTRDEIKLLENGLYIFFLIDDSVMYGVVSTTSTGEKRIMCTSFIGESSSSLELYCDYIKKVVRIL